MRKVLTILVIVLLLAFFISAMGGAGTSASAEEYDVYSPYLFNPVPSGNISTTSTTIGAGFNDFPPSSGINPDGTIVLLDGLPLSGCTTTGVEFGDVSCPVSGLGYGAHYYEIQVEDNAGNRNIITGNFTVSPSCEERTPLIVTAGTNEGPGTTFTVRVELDRPFVKPIINWDGGWIAKTWSWDSDTSGTATITIPAEAVSGVHQLRVYTSDSPAYATACPLEVIQDYTVAYNLPLSVGVAQIYWGSYADYLARELLVDYRIFNRGVNDALNVVITESNNTNGVIAINLPATVGNVPAGSTGIGTVRYSVPPNADFFRARLAATAEDAVGYPHMYP
ncbi:hypothetical protein C4544_02485 [candidate division WS5 bacterium]|uniref:Bacterial Ig-like domain-containing protein n=1 Tax=candidate division WS5 bacterium TaxID=2093353 RepID=A0A419DES3_9BACT|nr:MAG: hypothetical protein C4544_02485 [candidate division WS5 bacterium]